MATKDDVMAWRRYGPVEVRSDAVIAGCGGHLARGVAIHLQEALAELARLRAQLDGLAEHFDARADDARGRVDVTNTQSTSYKARGSHDAFREAAAHVRGIVKPKEEP